MQVISRNLPVDAVLFDLDGTLLDTAPDVGRALNHALAECGLPALGIKAIQTLIGGNSATLVRAALELLGAAGDARTLDSVLRSYEGGYQAICCSDGEQLTQLRPGVDEALDGLREMGLKLGIVTGHEDRFAAPLLRRFGLSAGVDIVVVDGNHHASGDPATCGLLHACEALGVEPAHTLFVGDSLDYALAAQSAGLLVICVRKERNGNHPSATLPCIQLIDELAVLPDAIGGPRWWRQPRRVPGVSFGQPA